MREALVRRAGGYVQQDVDDWLAYVAATGRGHYADPAARQVAADVIPGTLLTHIALLAALTHLQPDASADQLAFAGRLVNCDPEAASSLSAFLHQARRASCVSGGAGGGGCVSAVFAC